MTHIARQSGHDISPPKNASQNLYTTRLDASSSKISRSDADRIAAEIMAGDTTNRHLAEERGRALDDSGVRA